MGRMTDESKKREELATRTNQGITPTQRLISQFDNAWPRMAAAASNAISKERMYQLIVSTINRNPKLAECTPETVLSCFMRCTTLGLEPSDVDGLGRAYILPFYNKKKRHMEATFLMGYKGMIDLARRSGQIRDISARAVYEGDTFEFEYGLNETLRHIPGSGEKLPDKLTHVYCVVHFTDGGHYIDVMTRSEIEERRKRSQAGNSGPWVSDYEAMAKKTVIRRAAPYLPLSTQAVKAVASDDSDGGYLDMFVSTPIMETVEPVQETATIEVISDREGIGIDTDSQGEASREQEYGKTSLGDDSSQTVFAACVNCGNIREVSPGIQKDQLDKFLCCSHPDYNYI